MSNEGRPWARGESATPQQPDTALRMAARHLRLMADRYLKGNAPARDVDEAVRSWTVAQGEGMATEGPEVLEALRGLLTECEAMQGPELRADPTWGPLMVAATAAIAKAEGR
jgi:hypothetical protein